MPALSVRGIDDKTLRQLKKSAKEKNISVNRLVVDLLGAGPQASAQPPQIFDDLDALAGTWRKADAERFERDTAPFAEVDAALWK
ncbi:MAG: hypothetical protein JNJ55_11150 [Betaproteobacteria bacterium]|nr:hypothetical protein [Betaproteobacteria bacterium]